MTATVLSLGLPGDLPLLCLKTWHPGLHIFGPSPPLPPLAVCQQVLWISVVPPCGLACCSNHSLSHTTCWLLVSRLPWCWVSVIRCFLSPFSVTFLRCVFYPSLQAMLLSVLSSSVFNPAAQQTYPGPALLPAEHSFFLPPGWVASLQPSIGPASTADCTCSPNPS